MNTQFTHKTRYLVCSLIVIVIVLGLPACAGVGVSTSTATATMQPPEPAATATPTASPTATPSSTPTVTPTRGPSPTLAPTPVFGSARVGFDFLFGNQPEGCELPCWQGLRVGEANVEDVQYMFESAFELHGADEFYIADDAVTSMVWLSHHWILWENGVIDADLFSVSALLDLVEKGTGTLKVLRLIGDGDQFEPYSSPQYVLRNMGVPSQVLVSAFLEQTSDWYDTELLIDYEKGVTIYYRNFRARAVLQNKQTDEYAIELCLNNLFGSYVAEVYITKPLVGDDIDTLFSPLQYSGIHTEKIKAYFAPLEEVFETSLEEVTELAQQEDNACIYAPMP